MVCVIPVDFEELVLVLELILLCELIFSFRE